MLDLFLSLLVGFSLCFAVWSAPVEPLKGKVNSQYEKERFSASTPEQCWLACVSKDCVVSYSSGTCVVNLVTSQLVVWASAQGRLLGDDEQGWQTFINKSAKTFQAPFVLWVFDGVSRGMNLGSGGAGLDMNQTHGLHYDMKGPRPSRLGYARRPGMIRLNLNMVSITQRGRVLFTPSSPFTYATWFRVEDHRYNPIDLLTGEPSPSFAIDFMYRRFQDCSNGMADPCYADEDLDLFKLQVASAAVIFDGVHVASQAYPAPRTGWIHFAFVSLGGRRCRFYFNGRLWASRVIKSSSAYPKPKKLQMWVGGPGEYGYGSLTQACVALYKTAVEEADILNLMQTCP